MVIVTATNLIAKIGFYHQLISAIKKAGFNVSKHLRIDYNLTSKLRR
jgi:hypothetical protein